MDFADSTFTAILAPLFPCGIIDRQDIHNYKFIKFHDIRFDFLLLDMVDEVTETFGIIGDKFLLHGFSGGGQFTNRFYYLHPERLLAVSIGSPGRPTYLDENEEWYTGIKNFETIFDKKLDFEMLKKVPVLISVGLQDTEKIDYSEESDNFKSILQHGENRLERTRNLYQNFLAHDINVQLMEIDGASHEPAKVLDGVKQFFSKILEDI
ncbi:alpha/beta hydrolase family protein [Caproiciproducens faecalis]|uniref:Alpha/beta hydrolase n=1 Tax=Caproiciproducens faecalis TaxID=2820301 RepID=A0ABS7DPH4_9FIRM|nr:alpha/beta hydrolase [Caproiciproducens faecalis]MBW7573206.1 alpha/beta hydrolase [Caproiciproducens faecalis]